ncbi:hypothetical protein FRC08_006604 [Ceratobasidium sp. 394]|nr:hypothetical protein FRC08_006604 [Ceratobasidium sp. 394]
MSGFEIFGVIAATGPILESAIPATIRAVETLRDSNIIKEKTPADITTLSYELQLWYRISVQLLKNRSSITDTSQLATEFGTLFDDFPAVIESITRKSNRIIEKSALALLIYRSKLEGLVAELEKHLQCIFRRISLLVVRLRDVSSLSQHAIANDVLARVDRSDRIRDLLTARLDSKLEGEILVQDELADGQETIEGSEFYMAKLKSSQARVIVESRVYIRAPRELETTKSTIRRLRGIPPEHWPVLNCCGALEQSNDPEAIFLKILYTFPTTSSGSGIPITLGSALRSSGPSASANVPHYSEPLVTRLRLAKEIANAVLFVHIGGLVHKNIHPRTILLFPSSTQTTQSGGQSLGNAFLVGFTRSRDNKDISPALLDASTPRRIGEGRYDYPTRIYQHPNRGDNNSYTRYNMLHDIYALGVVLLEIGTWKPLLRPIISPYDAPSGGFRRLGLGPGGFALVCEQPVERFDPSDDSPAHLWGSAQQVPRSPAEIKAALITHARATLPFCMGNLYLDVVLRCLTCLDGEPGSSVSAKYIEEVLDMLDRIQV